MFKSELLKETFESVLFIELALNQLLHIHISTKNSQSFTYTLIFLEFVPELEDRQVLWKNNNHCFNFLYVIYIHAITYSINYTEKENIYIKLEDEAQYAFKINKCREIRM